MGEGTGGVGLGIKNNTKFNHGGMMGEYAIAQPRYQQIYGMETSVDWKIAGHQKVGGGRHRMWENIRFITRVRNG